MNRDSYATVVMDHPVGNCFRCHYMKDEDVKAWVKTLKTNITLAVWDFSCGDFGVEGAKAIAEALKVNSTVSHLRLRGSLNVSDGTGRAIARALEVNTTLMTLDISLNKIREEGARAIGEALKENTTLTELSLSDNFIGSAGVVSIAEALKENSTLTTLDLWNNGVGDIGFHFLAGALEVNTALTCLNIGYNIATATGVQDISGALWNNSTLTELDVRCNHFDHKGPQALEWALLENARLLTLKVDNDLEYPVIESRLLRNKRAREAARRAALHLVMIKKFRRNRLLACIQKEVMLMIAKRVWESRGQKEWLRAVE